MNKYTQTKKSDSRAEQDDEGKMEKAIFVVGAPRSGTTIFSKHLKGISGAVYLKKQNRILRKMNKLLYKFGLMKQSDFLDRKIKLDMTQQEFHNILRKNVVPHYDASGIFVNKRIANINLLPFLANQFARPTLVHIIRDPYNNVVSLLNRRKKVKGNIDKWWGVTPQGMPKKTGDAITDCAMQYKYTHLLIQQSQHLFINYITISYKEYCNNPQQTMNSILKKVSLNTDLPVASELITYRENSISSEVRNRISNIIEDGFVTNLYCEE
jgi:hypothetical protein